MPDTGKIAAAGFGAGSIAYVVLGGWTPNPSGGGGHTVDEIYALLLVMQDRLNRCLTLEEWVALSNDHGH